MWICDLRGGCIVEAGAGGCHGCGGGDFGGWRVKRLRHVADCWNAWSVGMCGKYREGSMVVHMGSWYNV